VLAYRAIIITYIVSYPFRWQKCPRTVTRGVARIFDWGKSAEGARSEAPKVPRGVGCGEGCPPHTGVPLLAGEGSGRAVPPPRKKLII